MKNSRNEKKFKNQSRDIDKAKITCFSCRKKGHYARDCHSKSRGKANVPERSKGPNYSAFSSEIRLVDLKKNLLSEGVIATKGMKIIKMYDYVDIYNCENELVGTAVRSANNLYHMLFRTVTYPEVNISHKNNLKIWHERTGHINLKALCEMSERG
ncbi:hypothetical protein AVEN_59359-1 [Araneus ventricosus]|uniref:CCHC-type domain-containing protein n=1 Tax=Araneus ventricosus TaxID=182803 RepID=A0A4Y2TW04_ARAVE|nr:hypothetical protein AVEN_59359-1 [Araneus ventricosus]